MDSTQTGSEAPKRTFRLRKARMAKGLTQIQLASATHMSINTLSRLENQELEEWPKKTIQTLVRMAQILDVEPLDLYDEKLRP